jgi:hypothetical protein
MRVVLNLIENLFHALTGPARRRGGAGPALLAAVVAFGLAVGLRHYSLAVGAFAAIVAGGFVLVIGRGRT